MTSMTNVHNSGNVSREVITTLKYTNNMCNICTLYNTVNGHPDAFVYCITCLIDQS